MVILLRLNWVLLLFNWRLVRSQMRCHGRGKALKKSSVREKGMRIMALIKKHCKDMIT